MDTEIWVALALVALFIGGSVWARQSEVKTWNGGYAPDGQKWVNFDMDSQGGRGYKTPTGSHSCWISWPGVDRAYNTGPR